jgi:hypothetical protein
MRVIMRVLSPALAAMVLALAGFSEAAIAQGAAASPRPITQPAPPQPTNRAGDTVEGWAVVRYSVLADGKTDNVRVVETVPPGIDTRPTVEAVRRWTFSPATEDGAAVDWHNTESLVVYRAPGAAAAEPSSEFEAGYQAIRALLEGEAPIDLEAALAMNQKLLEESATRIAELGLAMAQRTIIAFGLENWHEAYETIQLVTDPRIPALRGEDLLVALQLRLQLADRLGRTSDALETHGRIAAGLDPGQQDPFAAVADALRARLDDAEALQAAGYIDEEPWRVEVDRRSFTLANIEGSVEAIHAECDHRRRALDYMPDVDWRLPDSWGECVLFVAGDPGTSFRFVQFLPPAE